MPHAAEKPAQIDDHPAAELSARQCSGAGIGIGAVAEAEEGGYIGTVVAQQLPRCFLHDGRVGFGLFYACDCDAEGGCGGVCIESSLQLLKPDEAAAQNSRRAAAVVTLYDFEHGAFQPDAAGRSGRIQHQHLFGHERKVVEDVIGRRGRHMTEPETGYNLMGLGYDLRC